MRYFSASTPLCFVLPITVRQTPASFVEAKYLSSSSWNFNLVTTFRSLEQRLVLSDGEDITRNQTVSTKTMRVFVALFKINGGGSNLLSAS